MPDRDDEFPDVEFFADPPAERGRQGAREEPPPPAESEPPDLPGVGEDDAPEPFSLGEETGEHEEVARPRRRIALPKVRRRRRNDDVVVDDDTVSWSYLWINEEEDEFCGAIEGDTSDELFTEMRWGPDPGTEQCEAAS